MKILSLFDGMACWYEALVKAWIKVDKYYASEIDKYAIQVATKNHPDIIEVWDVKNLRGGILRCWLTYLMISMSMILNSMKAFKLWWS